MAKRRQRVPSHCDQRPTGREVIEAAFRRYTLNQRIEPADPFVSPSLWESCHGGLLRSPSCRCSMLGSICRR